MVIEILFHTQTTYNYNNDNKINYFLEIINYFVGLGQNQTIEKEYRQKKRTGTSVR